MTLRVAIIAPGRMGCDLGSALSQAGLRVVTPLEGRSTESRKRAAAAGMQPIAEAELADCDVILSVVPPSEALPVARRLKALLRDARRKPLVADLNAISPATALAVSQEITAAGCRFSDGCIIGTPQEPGQDGPFVYLSGDAAVEIAGILAVGLPFVEAIDGPTVAASAFKMCFAGVMKGLTSVGITLLLAANRSGAGDLMMRQLASSQPELWSWFKRQIPASHIKHGRWVAEMQEIAAFLAGAGDREGADQFHAHGRLFARLTHGDGDAERLRKLFE